MLYLQGSEIIEEIVSDGFKFKNKISNKAFLIEKFQHQLNMKKKYKKEELSMKFKIFHLHKRPLLIHSSLTYLFLIKLYRF